MTTPLGDTIDQLRKENAALKVELDKYKRALEWASRRLEPHMNCPEEAGWNCSRDGHWECWQCVQKMALTEAEKAES